MPDTPHPPGDTWSIQWIGTYRYPSHCRAVALDLDLGEWECRWCGAVVHVRDIPGWRDSVTRGQQA
jgi:hypothetical protein